MHMLELCDLLLKLSTPILFEIEMLEQFNVKLSCKLDFDFHQIRTAS